MDGNGSVGTVLKCDPDRVASYLADGAFASASNEAVVSHLRNSGWSLDGWEGRLLAGALSYAAPLAGEGMDDAGLEAATASWLRFALDACDTQMEDPPSKDVLAEAIRQADERMNDMLPD